MVSKSPIPPMSPDVLPASVARGYAGAVVIGLGTWALIITVLF